MSELTKRLREAEEAHRMARHEDGSPDEVALRDLGYAYGCLHGQSADRIDELEECLRGIMVEWDGYGIADSSLTRAIDKARALLEEK